MEVSSTALFRILLVGSCLSTGCVRRTTTMPIGVTAGAAYTARADTSPESPYSNPIDDAALALGLASLQRASLPEGWRELRISGRYSMIAGAPSPVLRLVESPDHAVTGQLIWVWVEQRDWAASRRKATRCTEWVSGRRTCALVAAAAGVDWPTVARRLHELEAWTIASRCEVDGKAFMDSGELHVSRLVGGRFDAYSCNAPRQRVGTSAGQQALALYEYFESLVRLTRMTPS